MGHTPQVSIVTHLFNNVPVSTLQNKEYGALNSSEADLDKQTLLYLPRNSVEQDLVQVRCRAWHNVQENDAGILISHRACCLVGGHHLHHVGTSEEHRETGKSSENRKIQREVACIALRPSL